MATTPRGRTEVSAILFLVLFLRRLVLAVSQRLLYAASGCLVLALDALGVGLQQGGYAARQDNLAQAASLGHTALTASRQSLPSLLMVAGELDSELERRFRESETQKLPRFSPHAALSVAFPLRACSAWRSVTTPP